MKKLWYLSLGCSIIIISRAEKESESDRLEYVETYCCFEHTSHSVPDECANLFEM